ncbi:ATP-binding protein [Actinotalea sp. BY-33]|uniref:ATP-binding protein n=1 Tax=Actinotalea soli TaxID=2819234 RepID=A0A939LUT0_9CELL|nr:ATP-binding protein [Actinotalea soli]MBO1753090.1 ATP-binding protein [Actinotalea soli]
MPSPRGDTPGVLRIEGCVAPECLDHVQDAIVRLWEGAPQATDEARMMFEIAVVEVVGNVVEHAPKGRGFEATVRLGVEGDAAWAEILDTGPALDIDLDAGLPEDLAESGRGLALARRAAHELTLDRVGDHNLWTVLRRW